MLLVRKPDTRPLAVDVVGHGGRVDKGIVWPPRVFQRDRGHCRFGNIHVLKILNSLATKSFVSLSRRNINDVHQRAQKISSGSDIPV